MFVEGKTCHHQPFGEEKEELNTRRGIGTIHDNVNFVKLFCFNDSVRGTEGANSNVGEDVPYTDTDLWYLFSRETIYGRMWYFTSDFSRGDTAYTKLALDRHTDTTYFQEPCGYVLLQGHLPPSSCSKLHPACSWGGAPSLGLDFGRHSLHPAAPEVSQTRVTGFGKQHRQFAASSPSKTHGVGSGEAAGTGCVLGEQLVPREQAAKVILCLCAASRCSTA